MKYWFRGFFLLGIIALFHGESSAQNTEFGVLGGVTSYRGELNPEMFSRDLKLYHPALGLFFRRNWNSHYSFRLNGIYGKISGDDSRLRQGFALKRNLSFFSPLYEVAGLFEFNFLPFEKYGSTYRFTPFVFTGLSVFYFQPASKIAGETISLQPLSLEGKSYSLIQMALPMGIGIKFRARGWVFAAEAGPRKTSTDYLDNVSSAYLDKISLSGYSQSLGNPSADTTIVNLFGRQRGNSKDKDWYMFIGITLSHKIGNALRRECQRLMRNQ